MLYLVEVVQQRHIQSFVREANMRLDPLQELLGPRLEAFRLPAMTQQEFAQPVPRLQLILLGGLPRPHQIPQCFLLRAGHGHSRQLAGAVATRQLLGVAAVGLNPLAFVGIRLGAITSHSTSICVSCQYKQ